MARINSGLLTRIAAPFCKFTLALGAALGIASAVYAENYWWTGSGTDTNYDTPANWGSENGSTYPGSDDGAMFNGAAAEKTVTFNGAYTPSWIWVATDDVTKPVTWTATAGGSASTTFNIGLADQSDQVGALVVESGTYTAAGGFNVGPGQAAFEMTGGTITANGVSQWAYAENAALTADIKGGTLNFNGVDGNDGLRMMYGNGVSNVITVSNATFAVNNGDLVIGVDADATSSTTINIDQDGVVSCGTPSIHRWLKMNSLGKVTINVNEGGTLAVWHIAHDAAGECKINLNGGKLKVLGGAGAGVIGVENDASLIVTVGEKGGTLEVPTGVSASVLKNLKGEGTLTVTGGGSATFAPQGNTCQIVADGATVLTNVDNHWNAGGGVDTDWNTSSNWDTGLGGALNAVFHSAYLNGAETTATFAGAYSYQAGLWIENGLDGIVTFSKAESAVDTAGLAVANNITIGTATSGALKIASGTYSVNGSLFVGYSTGSASLTMEDGTVSVVGDFDVGIKAATSTFTQNGGTITGGANGWWGADNSKAVADINDGSISFTGNLNLLNQNDTGDAASYITNTVAGGTLSANEIWFLGKAGHATVNLSSGTIETGKFGVNGSGIYAINISGGTVVAAADGTFIPASDKLTVTVDGNATLNTNGKTITIDAAMLGDGTLTCVGGGTVTFTSLVSTCNIVADGATVNQPSVTYWVGGASGNWNDGGNWSSGEVPTGLAMFTNSVSVIVGATYSIESFYMAENVVVTLAGGGMLTGIRNLGEIATEGDKIVLDGVNLASIRLAPAASTVWYSDIEIPENDEVYLYCNGDKETSTSCHVDYYGNLTGLGTVHLSHNGDNDTRGGISLYGNNEAFAGVCKIHSGSMTRGPATFCSATSGSAKARWVYVDGIQLNTSARAGTINGVSNATIKFGSYEGNSYILGMESNTGNTIEIGALNSNFECSLSAVSAAAERANNNATLRKVGTGTMTFGNATGNPCFNYYEMAGGILKFANASILSSATGSSSSMQPSYKFTGGAVAFTDEAMVEGNVVDISALIKNSTGAISIVVDANQEITWGTALASSNKGGLVKDGEGTLTLSKQPLYSGLTKVLGGTLVVPAGTSLSAVSIADGAKCSIDLSEVTEDTPDGVLFSVSAAPGTVFSDSNVNLINKSETVACSVVYINEGKAIAVLKGGARTLTWNGSTDASQPSAWEDASSWLEGPVTAETAPTSLDFVVFNTSTPAFTLASDAEVMGLTVTVQDFDFNADKRLSVIGDFAMSVAGVLNISGAGFLEVKGEMSGINSITMTPRPATSEIISAHPYYTEKIFTGSDLELGSLTGAGTIESTVDQTVTIAQDETSTFYGSFAGTMGLTKNGGGTLELQGPNSFEGSVAINAGTFKISRYNYDSLVAYNFDVSDNAKTTVTKVEGSDTLIKSIKPTVGLKWQFDSKGSANAEIIEDAEYFDGQKVMWFPNNAIYNNGTKGTLAWTIMTVYQRKTAPTGAAVLHQYSTASQYLRLNGSTWQYVGQDGNGASKIYVDGVRDAAFTADKKSIVTLNTAYCGNSNNGAYNRYDNVGYSFDGAVAEVIGFARDNANRDQTPLSVEQRAAIESYLMQKWGCDDAKDHQILPKTADVTMKSGATLDMGGLTQTVTSFTGAGTVANGYLKTTGDLTVDGGTLTIQATAGQTYVLSDVEAERLVLTGDAKGYTVKVPDNGRIVGRFVVPEGISVGFEGEGADVTVVNAPKGWEITSKQITGGILYRVGSFPFKLILR